MYHVTVTQTEDSGKGPFSKTPLSAGNRALFVSACFHLQCPLLVRLQNCRAAQCWLFLWHNDCLCGQNLLGKPERILTSMPSDPGVPEGPAGPGGPWGPGGPLWNTNRKTFPVRSNSDKWHKYAVTVSHWYWRKFLSIYLLEIRFSKNLVLSRILCREYNWNAEKCTSEVLLQWLSIRKTIQI